MLTQLGFMQNASIEWSLRDECSVEAGRDERAAGRIDGSFGVSAALYTVVSPHEMGFDVCGNHSELTSSHAGSKGWEGNMQFLLIT